MRTFIMAAFLAIPVIASAQPTLTLAPGLSSSPAAREVQDMERQLHEVYIKGDKPSIRSRYADDSTFTYSTGRTLGPDERVKGMRAFPDLRTTVDNLRLYGDGTAVVNGTSAFKDADGNPFRVQNLRVWVKQGRAWKVAALQSTPVE